MATKPDMSSLSTPLDILQVREDFPILSQLVYDKPLGYFDSAAFAANVGRGMLDTCSPTRFCREDYICQAMPEDLTRGAIKPSAQALNVLKTEKIGFCTPTYFVYQLRLDGHPNPK